MEKEKFPNFEYDFILVEDHLSILKSDKSKHFYLKYIFNPVQVIKFSKKFDKYEEQISFLDKSVAAIKYFTSQYDEPFMDQRFEDDYQKGPPTGMAFFDDFIDEVERRIEYLIEQNPQLAKKDEKLLESDTDQVTISKKERKDESRIQWMGQDNQLIYLIDLLILKGFLPQAIEGNKWELISKCFKDSQGRNFVPKDLANKCSLMYKNKQKKPRKGSVLEETINSLEEIKDK